jgi:hypothetical protein
MSAIEDAGAELVAAGEAERLAWEAMRDGHLQYTDRLGWAQRNLFECWYFFTRMTRLRPRRPETIARARHHLRRAIKQYRHLNIAETRGIDTSVPGWRGGRAA